MAKKKQSEIHKVFKGIHRALADLETWVTAAQAELAEWLRPPAKKPKAKKGTK